MSNDWRAQCERRGVAADLIERIARRYEAYAANTAGRRSMSLSEWFKWYALENAAQMRVDRVPVQECSVEDQAHATPSLDRSADILDLVRQRLETGTLRDQ